MNERILDYLSSEPHKKVTIEELRTVLHVSSSDEIKELMKAVNELIDQALVIEGPNYEITKIENTNYMVGRLDLKTRGFGFVIPEDPSLNDVFVPKDQINDAMNNDIVLVQVSAGYGARQEGTIKRVLERKYTHIIGTVLSGRKNALLRPDDQTVQSSIFIQPKNLNGAKENDKVWAKIINYSYKGRMECKVDQILGNINEPGIDVLSKLFQYNIDPIFPEPVIKEAKDVSVLLKEDYKGRRDLRDLPYITIDGDDAKDFDDAVYVTMNDKGDYILGVSIADVSHYVKEGSILDKEAFRRGTSIYLADRVVPMLPEELSNDICSLKPHEDRLTITCEMVVSPSGKVKRYDIYPSVIHSSYRMTYNKVNAIYNGDVELAEEYVEIVGMLYQMRNLAKTLTKKREQLGSIQFETDESYFVIDEFGRTVDVQPRKRGISETIIEEFMLLANKTVAEHIHWMDLPFIYRIHEKPTEEKLGRLINMASALGYQVKGKTEVSHHELQKLVDFVHGTEMEKGINLLMLRSMQKAIYSEINLGHYGLAFDFYTHFTSPIRRYPDLMVHRLLRTYLFQEDTTKQTVDHYRDNMHDIATRSSKTERTAIMVERDVADMKKAEYISNYIGERYDGIISSVTNFGLYVSLPNTVEGLVHMSNLNDDYYHYAPDLMMLIGEHTKKTYKVGDHVTIQVIGASVIDGDVDFKIVKRGENSETRRSK